MRQIHIFFNFSKAIRQFCLIIYVLCKSCKPEIVFVLICTLAKQFHVCKSYKTRKSTFSCIGSFEENINPYHIHLAVLQSVPCA